MPQPPGYPKRVWGLIQAHLIVEDGREVLVRDDETVLAMTYEPAVAELLIAKMRERESATTIVRSGLQPLPSAILESLEPASSILLEIADASVPEQD